MIEQLTTLQALIKKSREYLNSRLENPDHPMDTESTLEEWIGHAWQIAELREWSRSQRVLGIAAVVVPILYGSGEGRVHR